MNQLSTTILIALVIVANDGSGATTLDDTKADQLADESKYRAVTIIDSPKYVEQPKDNVTTTTAVVPHINNLKSEQRPPSKLPIPINKQGKQIYYADIRPYYGHIQKIPPPRHYPKPPLKLHHSPNSVYKFPRVIPLPPHLKNHYYMKPRPMMFAASNAKVNVAKSPKFSLPVQTINGITTDFVRPPKYFNITTTTTTTSTEATTTKVLRTKRIWPKRVIEYDNTTLHNTTVTKNTTNSNNTSGESDQNILTSIHRVRFVHRNATKTTTTSTPLVTTRSYRPVTRTSKIKSTTTPTISFTATGPNNWVPMLPSHFPKLSKPIPTPINKRSDIVNNEATPAGKQTLYLQSFGIVPVPPSAAPAITKKKMVLFKRKRQLNPHLSGYSPKPVRMPTQYMYGDLQTDGSYSPPRVVTKIKHHHHHHHHRYIKTVEKPVKVPYKVEVPKPYPVPVEKKVPVPVEKIKVVEKPVPYPVTVEKKVPYPIEIKVPHPVPVKVVEKEYVPKPYPIIHHVPVIKHVQVKVPHPVPVPVERKVPYPVEVRVPVPVDRPVPVPVPVEKRVPYPVPVKVLVPQPYPVETKVPYPVQVKVKEPVEVIKHVHVKVPYPQPYPVKVPHPVPFPVEKKIPYRVEVEKRVPVPVQVFVPQKVEVEKKVPVYIPKPYPVEKRVPVPVKVPYPIKVPVKVPVQVPIEVPVYMHHPYQVYNDEHYVSNQISVTEPVTSTPHHTVTVHGNTGFTGFHSHSNIPDEARIGANI